MAKSVVTGGFGFVGGHVVERLLRAGDEVTVLDSAPCPDDLETGSGTLRVVSGDVRDEDAVAAALSGGADVIYHLAAVVGVDRYLRRPLDVIDVNVLGTRAVLAAAAAGDVKVVVASTSEVYGKNPQVPWAEDTDRLLGSTSADRWCYASSKALAEHMTHAFARNTGLRTCILRYFNVYGPRQRPAYVLSRTIHRLLQQLPPQVFDGGQQTRCFTYVADAAEATVLAGVSDAAVGQCFNIGSDEEISVADAVALAVRMVGAGPAPVPLDTRFAMRGGYEDIARRVPDVGHVERTLGWRARTSLEEGLRLTIEWARHGNWRGIASAGHPVVASDLRPVAAADAAVGAGAVAAFGPAHADVYEETYRARGKDWALEAADIARLVRARRPQAQSLLDVACGTGAHLETFRSLFGDVAGVEISPAMRMKAQRRLPGVEVYSGDMRDFFVGRSFDAVTCLYTAISYLPSVADMRRAVRRMAHHLVPGGVLVVEPWWYPDQFIPGYVGGDLVRSSERTIARVSHTTRVGRVARMEVQWVVGQRGGGLQTFAVVETFTMFMREEFAAAFDAAGCDVEIHDHWLTGHGLLVAVRRPH